MQTSSIAFPRMFDVARNRVAVLEDNQSIVNRTKLLILTEPTELYNNPDFGVGLKRNLWQYNTDNQRAIVKARIYDQLLLHEPCVDTDQTQMVDGLLFTGDDNMSSQEYNKMKLTAMLITTFGDQVQVDFKASRDSLFGINTGGES